MVSLNFKVVLLEIEYSKMQSRASSEKHPGGSYDARDLGKLSFLQPPAPHLFKKITAQFPHGICPVLFAAQLRTTTLITHNSAQVF
jgi:hypothetical protein